MKNEELRKLLDTDYPDTILFDNPAYDNSIVGISTDGCLVYDFYKMAKELSEDDNITIEDAIEFIEYNAVRALPYVPYETRPIIVDFRFLELYNE